jgi:anaerobic selenocysteine-containing dehydrogenase
MRVLSRRLHEAHNSNWRDNDALKSKYAYNPAFVNPADLADLGIEEGSVVEIESERATIKGVAVAAPDVRRGCISMSHCWGDNPNEPDDPLGNGANTGRLCFTDRDYDQRTGIPRMSNIPVKLRALSV